MNKKEILERGYVDVKIHVSGIRQAHRLEIVRERTSQGSVSYLVSKSYIPNFEMIKLAQEFQLPIRCRSVIVFPRGKMISDFIEKGTSIGSGESNTIIAEVEE